METSFTFYQWGQILSASNFISEVSSVETECAVRFFISFLLLKISKEAYLRLISLWKYYYWLFLLQLYDWMIENKSKILETMETFEPGETGSKKGKIQKQDFIAGLQSLSKFISKHLLSCCSGLISIVDVFRFVLID